MNKFIGGILIASMMILTACGKSDHTSGIPSTQQVQQQNSMQPAQVNPVNPTGTVQQAPNTTIVQAPAQAPVIVQQESSSVMPALLGAAAGYMLGSSGNSRQETRVVEREVYRETPQRSYSGIGSAVNRSAVPTPAPAVVPKPTVPSTPAFTAPSVPKVVTAPPTPPKPSFSGGYNSGYSSVKQSAPTYKSSSSFGSSRSSSFGSRRR